MSLMREIFKPLGVIAMTLSLAACSALPSSGPAGSKIYSDAATRVSTPSTGAAQLQYALVDLNQNTVAKIPDYTFGSLNTSFGAGKTQPTRVTIGIGDELQVTIFEAAESGLFTAAKSATDIGATVHSAQLPKQTVDPSGLITVPYAGSIKAAGMTTTQLEGVIERRLADRAIEPKAVVTLGTRSASAVTVLGAVTTPQKLAINPSGDRILDVLARAGGLTSAPYETFVTLERNGRKASVYFNRIVDVPSENIYVVPGDTIVVDHDKRMYTAFGSTGKSDAFDFGAESINLDTAVAKAGGLLDNRADARQVFVYRVEDRSVLMAMGANLSMFPASQKEIPTIYRANFADPGNFFYARKFPMRNGDLLYVSNADSVSYLKFLGVVGATFGTTDAGITAVNDGITLSRR